MGALFEAKATATATTTSRLQADVYRRDFRDLANFIAFMDLLNMESN